MSGGTTETRTNTMSPWMEEAAKAQLGKATALTDTTQNPYQQYGGQRIEGFTDLQNKAFTGVENLGPANAIGQGIDAANTATNRALNTSYDPAQFNAQQVQAQGLNQYQMGPAERVRTQSFAMPGAAEAYMSPYMQNVVDMQQREARRASDIQRNQSQAQAVGQGAFGGSRQAIIEAERQRNLGTQLGDIQATGSQAAYQQAQQQFNAEQAARLQAQQANQQAGLTVGQQNLAANLGVQQLGAGQNLQAQLANQQYGLNAQQLAEQSRQFGSSQGLEGLRTALSGASQLGGLGSTQFGQQKDIIGAQQAAGAMQQAQKQAGLTQNYEDFLNKQRYPYEQLEFMSNIMRGTPYNTTTSVYKPGASTGSQLLGAGTSLLGSYMLGGGKIFKEGGKISDAKIKRETKKSAGLAELALSKI
jgi:hypothetical protein